MMKHTELSKQHARTLAGARSIGHEGIQFQGYGIGSCAYATCTISGIDTTIPNYESFDRTTGKYPPCKGNAYEIIVSFLKKYRVPVMFCLMDLPQPGKLNKEKLEAFHQEGKYLEIKFVTETEGWHGTKSVGLYLAELNE